MHKPALENGHLAWVPEHLGATQSYIVDSSAESSRSTLLFLGSERDMEEQTTALIITRSAQIRDSLLILMRAIPRIDRIHHAEDGPSALAMKPEIHPALVLVDYDPPQNQVRAILGQIKTVWPQARCVALLDDEQDRGRAEDAGADIALVKGVLAAKLLETIEEMLGGTQSSERNQPPPAGGG